MMQNCLGQYDIAVIGAGHAGCEAAFAAARLGCSVVIFATNLDAVAKIAGVLGICLVGKASDVGTLQQENKCRGEKRSADQLYANMKNEGFAGGKVRIGHNLNLKLAEQFAEMIRAEYPQCDIAIEQNSGLCCFYAEEGGLMVGYEDSK